MVDLSQYHAQRPLSPLLWSLRFLLFSRHRSPLITLPLPQPACNAFFSRYFPLALFFSINTTETQYRQLNSPAFLLPFLKRPHRIHLFAVPSSLCPRSIPFPDIPKEPTLSVCLISVPTVYNFIRLAAASADHCSVLAPTSLSFYFVCLFACLFLGWARILSDTLPQQQKLGVLEFGVAGSVWQAPIIEERS